jgi:short-subunit dehydrogenase
MTRISGSVCLVTGATGGIGGAVVELLRRRGAEVIASGRDRHRLDALAAVGVTAIAADLAAPGGAEALAARAIEPGGRVDVLVNCAGAGWAGEFEGMEPAEIDALVTLNLTAILELTRALLPGMLERGHGHVVNVASIAGHAGVASEAVYSAAKAGLIAFADSLRLETWGRGLLVSTVSPGAVATSFFARRGRPYDRPFPPPVTAGRVAEAVVSAIEHDRAQVFVPRWLGLAARVKGAAPGVYRTLARRFG